MSIVEMEHLTLVGHQSEMPGLIHYLSNAGVVEVQRDESLELALEEAHITEEHHAFRREIPGLDFGQAFRTRMAQLADPRAFTEGLLSSSMTDYPRYISEATRLIEFLDRQIEYCDELDPQGAPLLAKRRKVAFEDYQKLSDRQKEILDAAQVLEDLRLEMEELSQEKIQAKHQLEGTLRWANLPIPNYIENPRKDGTEHVNFFVGIFRDQEALDEAGERLEEAELKTYSYEILEREDDALAILVAVHRDEADDVVRILQEQGFEMPPELPEVYHGNFKKAKAARQKHLEDIETEIAQREEKAKILAKARGTFELLSDFYRIQQARMESMERIAQTPNMFVLTGWCIKREVDDLVEDLRDKFTLAIEHRPPREGEVAPTLLENSPVVSPFEEVVLMFSAPKYGVDIDPSFALAPLYSFFFGIMLSDVGYGLLLMLGCAALIWGFKVEGSFRKMALVLFDGGIFSVFWGIMFGSFFGDLLSIVSQGAITFEPVWFDPLEDPLKLMIWSMIFGVIHLFIGMALKIYMYSRDGKVYAALTTIAPWYLILTGLGLMIGTDMDWPKYMALAGALILVFLPPSDTKNPIKRFFKNLAGLYDIANYLGDILSYTRILALTLATAVIALVVNILLKLIGFSFPAIIFSIIIMVLGHLLNLALSGLSAYVHSLRLHFVEFFGQFYEGAERF